MNETGEFSCHGQRIDILNPKKEILLGIHITIEFHVSFLLGEKLINVS